MNPPDAVVWPSAGSTAPKVKPPATAALPFKKFRRSGRLAPIGLSFENDIIRRTVPDRVYRTSTSIQALAYACTSLVINISFLPFRSRPKGGTMLPERRKPCDGDTRPDSP